MQINKKTIITALSLLVITITSCNSKDRSPITQAQAFTYAREQHNVQQRRAPETSVTTEIVEHKVNKNEQLITAAEGYFADDLLQNAENMLDQVDLATLDNKQSVRYILLQKKLLTDPEAPSDTEEDDEANIPAPLADNQTINNKPIPVDQNADPFVSQAQRQRVASPLFVTKNDNRDAVWQKIITQDPSTINQLINKYRDNQSNIDSNLNGWLELAKLSKESNQHSDNEYVELIKNWQAKFSGHPGNNLLAKIAPTSNNQFHKIAVLLPLTGNLAPAGKAIRDGILSGYYMDEKPNKAEIVIIDTKNDSENSILEYYNQAKQKNADIIIGPLNKKAVAYLKNNTDGQIPIIALNYIPEDLAQNYQSNFYQFGISAEDEADQAALKIWKSNLKKPLIIVDDNEWGYRVSQTFKEKISSLTGNTPKITFINSNSNFKKLIYSDLGIEDSQKRKNVLQNAIGIKLNFEPRVKQDFDNIFLATSSAEARQIKPILKFYYADNIPIIATSNILDYKANVDESLLKDLAGIEYCDIPLIIHQDAKNKQLLAKLQNSLLKNHHKLIRLYALGMDAYSLTGDINKLAMAPDIGLAGNTGHLLLNADGKITRKLPWARISSTQVKMLDFI